MDILDRNENYNNFEKPTQGDAGYEAFQKGLTSEEPNPYDLGSADHKQFMLGYSYKLGLEGKLMTFEDSPELEEANKKGIKEFRLKNERGWFTSLLIWLGIKDENEYNNFIDGTLQDVIPFNNATGNNLGTGLIIGSVVTLIFLKKEMILRMFSGVSKGVKSATR